MLKKMKSTEAQKNNAQLQTQVTLEHSDIQLQFLQDGTYLIDHKAVPYIFRFNYGALQKVRLSNSPRVPKIAHDIFYYLKDKLLVGRYSQGGRYPNRMKYQQKVKFVMRAFDHTHLLNRKQNTRQDLYNIRSQMQFFSREDVRLTFLSEIQKALRKKQVENQRKIYEFEYQIEATIQISREQPQIAENMFKEKIQRKQLPWTDNMFMDISDFSRVIYTRHTKLDRETKKKILQLPNYEPGQWQVVGNKHEKKNENIEMKDEMQQKINKEEFQLENAD